MDNIRVHDIFPTTVMFGDLGRDFTKDELELFTSNGLAENTVYNIGNVCSKNNYILNDARLAELKKDITSFVNAYVANIIKPKFNVEIYITQSWLNYTEKGKHHHSHAHPNSYLSGVLYVQASDDLDKIYFNKDRYEQIKIYTETFDERNSDSWFFNIKSKDIVVFPSSLNHHVETVKAEDTRISLAFNTFVKGTLGSNGHLTELILNG